VCEVIRRLEEVWRDLARTDERLDVDGLGRLDVCATKVLIRQDYILALLVLIALDDVVPLDGLAGGLVDSLVADRCEIASVQQVQVELVRARCGVQRHRNVNEAEADCTFPEDFRHDVSSDRTIGQR
jgi:hypothetical protein